MDEKDYPRAVVREGPDGQLVLDDPDALEMIRAVEKHNCKQTFELNTERIGHFIRRIGERGHTVNEVVIIILNVDDPHGGPVAEHLMPGHNWQEYRDRGEIPFARGLATREGIQGILDLIDKDAAEKLRANTDQTAVVVMDHGVAEVFHVEPPKARMGPDYDPTPP